MRAGGGKAKGANFEREVCKKLSLWLTFGKHEGVFWRSAMSGGRSTVAARRGVQLGEQAGDLSSVHPAGNAFIGKFVVECKTYKNLDFHGLPVGRGALVDFWAQVTGEARHFGKLPILIAKQNQQPTLICFSNPGLVVCALGRHVVLTAPQLGLNALLFEEFLKSDPSRMIAALKASRLSMRVRL